MDKIKMVERVLRGNFQFYVELVKLCSEEPEPLSPQAKHYLKSLGVVDSQGKPLPGVEEAVRFVEVDRHSSP